MACKCQWRGQTRTGEREGGNEGEGKGAESIGRDGGEGKRGESEEAAISSRAWETLTAGGVGKGLGRR